MTAFFLALSLIPSEAPPDDRPPASDLDRFPSRQVADELEQFGRAHLGWIAGQAALDLVRPQFWREWQEEAESLRLTWGLLRDAHDAYDDDKRRWKLKRLRESIGEEAYWLGRMPPHIPVWRFRRFD